jgi:hypothetical protein
VKASDIWKLAVEIGSGVYGGTLAVFSAVLLYLFVRYRRQGWTIAKDGAALVVQGVAAVTNMANAMREMAADTRASREAAVRSEAALQRIEAQGAASALSLARIEGLLAGKVPPNV